jgi:hypothetical protein
MNMNNYEKLAFVANLVLLVLIVTQFLQYWIIALPMLLILIIILVHKINVDKKFRSWDDNELRWDTEIKNNSFRINELNENVIEWKVENQRHLNNIEEKLAKQKKDMDETNEKNFRMVVGRIAEVENRLNHTKRTLAAYMAYLEAKMKRGKGE